MFLLHKRIVLVILCALATSVLFGANGFTTKKLQSLSANLAFIPFEQLGEGLCYDYCYEKCPLNIRVNEWNEVEHIGFKFFDRNTLPESQRLVVDFVERYLLEIEMITPNDRNHRLSVDKVSVVDGSLDNILQLINSERYDLVKLDMLKYQVAWFCNDHCLLKLLFDMDFQLLSGCNSIELEQNYLRNLGKCRKTIEYGTEVPIANDDETYAILDGGSYLSPSIRADRYYLRDSDASWKLVCSGEKPYWSAANIMLSPELLGDFQLSCTLDMYGYKEEKFRIAIEQWVSQTLSEGCKMFFGVKSKTQKTLRCTLFCPNFDGGYCHLLTLEMPMDMFDKSGGVVIGRLYAYVPLHNIEEDYFDADYITVTAF